MIFIKENIFLIMSDCGKLVAKGTPRSRYICHIDEKDKKRFLTYSSLGRANSAFQDSGFYLSEYTKKYISEKYPLIKKDWIGWNDIEHLFHAKEFSVSYNEVE